MVGGMELRHLRYFVAVAEELNFTRAAARLRVAQPALSSQIKDLEQELVVTLFQRGRMGVQLTRAGKAFYIRARNILAQAAEAATEAKTAAGTITGSLVLGFLSGLHLNYLAPLIRAYKRAQPKVIFEYLHGSNNQQVKALREGRLDIGFVLLPAPLEGCAHQIIWRIPFKVVLPRQHRLSRKNTFELADLRGEDFVFCTRESRPEFYDEFFRQCADAGFRPRVVKEVGGYPTNMLGLVSVGLGISVLPHFRGVEQIQGIVWRTLAKPKLSTDCALVWSHPPTSPVVEQFVATAQKKFPLPQDPDRAEL
jgi:DNA-binding transcriptional LysR family regulator